jgi:uncharacterized protein
MILEGVVSNVANFGAFIDIGVHQDGLVHISSMTNTYISDPREVVKTGDVVKVKVMEVDVARKRISLSMRMDDTPTASDNAPKGRPERTTKAKPQSHKPARAQKPAAKQSAGNAAMGNAFADAFNKAKK